MATTPGENYSSSIYRVTVELSNGESRSFVVKGPPPGQTLREATLELDIFRREGFMLGDVIPQIEAMLEEAAPGQFPPLAARCPLYDREYLVMQDLATAGFKMADRKRGLDLKHSLLVLRCLARYHAGTHALLRQKPEIADRLPSMWLKPHPATAAFVEGGVQMAADACRLWPGYEEYATLLDEFKTIAMETFLEVNTPKPDEFTVIVHSDFWVNNMMFRYDEDNPEPKGHRMVDFQGSTVGSPTLDLLYFLSTSVTEEVSADNEDLLIREYHRTLDDTLRLLKLEAPPLSELLRALSAHGPFALMGCLTVIPLVRAQRAADLEAGLAGDASALAYLYEDAAVRRWLQRLLPEYKRRGWLPRPDA